MAGSYRLIDVSLSNLVNSQISNVWIVEEYQPHSLNQYLSVGRPWDLDRTHGGLQLLAPFSGDEKGGFSDGNSDSLWRQNDRMKDHDPDLVIVLSADHFYTIDFLDIIATHRESDADLTMVTTVVDEDASRYSVVKVNPEGGVTDFWYKPDEPKTNLVAAEIFCFSASELFSALDHLHDKLGKLSDYGDGLLPWYVEHKKVVEHRLDGYWKDLGTLTAYWEAHIDLLHGTGVTLDDPTWPIHSAQPNLLPARIEKPAAIDRSYVAPGSVVSGKVHDSFLSPLCSVEEGAAVQESILLDNVQVPAGVHLRRCIVESGAQLKPGSYGTDDLVTLIDADGNATKDA